MEMDDLVQWIALGVILLIIGVIIVKRFISFRRALRNSGGEDCGRGCNGCNNYCQLADKTIGKDGK